MTWYFSPLSSERFGRASSHYMCIFKSIDQWSTVPTNAPKHCMGNMILKKVLLFAATIFRIPKKCQYRAPHNITCYNNLSLLFWEDKVTSTHHFHQVPNAFATLGLGHLSFLKRQGWCLLLSTSPKPSWGERACARVSGGGGRPVI